MWCKRVISCAALSTYWRVIFVHVCHSACVDRATRLGRSEYEVQFALGAYHIVNLPFTQVVLSILCVLFSSVARLDYDCQESKAMFMSQKLPSAEIICLQRNYEQLAYFENGNRCWFKVDLYLFTNTDKMVRNVLLEEVRSFLWLNSYTINYIR